MGTVIGIDPAAAKPNAMAMIHSEVCIYAGDVDPDIKIIIGFFKKHKPDLIAIEGQYGGPNIKTLIQLAEARGRLVAACEYCDIPHQIVQPQQWMNSIGVGPQTKRGKQRDEWIITITKVLLDKDPGPEFNIDHAAAVAIAYYAYKRFKFKNQVIKQGDHHGNKTD